MTTAITRPEPATALPLRLHALDGWSLGAIRYPASGRARGRIVVAGATAVRQELYRRFAQFAAARGYEVLTFDYRGIGQSAPAALKGFRMSYLDWARLDLAAVITAESQDGLPLFVVGHSYGGHAYGLLPNHDRTRGLYVFGAGAGWHGWMPPLERLKVLAMWHLILPPLTAWKGYCPWQWLGLGENLPIDVYRQWKRWCRYPRYFFDDPEQPGLAPAFAAVRTPIVAVNATDDRWAPPRSRDAFMAGYTHAPLQRLDLDPARLGGPIGHMGYFRKGAEPLWTEALDWLDRTGAAAVPVRDQAA